MILKSIYTMTYSYHVYMLCFSPPGNLLSFYKMKSFLKITITVNYLPIMVLPAVRPDVIASSKPATVRPPVTSPAAHNPGIALPSVPMTSALVLTFKPPFVM